MVDKDLQRIITPLNKRAMGIYFRIGTIFISQINSTDPNGAT